MSDLLLAAPVRAGVLAFLSIHSEGDFTSLARALGIANNTLSSHLQQLETAGWVELKRGFFGRKPRTTVVLTSAGMTGWSDHLEQLKGDG